jgi:hypothetical protein
MALEATAAAQLPTACINLNTISASIDVEKAQAREEII